MTDIFPIVVIIALLVSILWSVWLGQLLRSRKATLGDATPPPALPAYGYTYGYGTPPPGHQAPVPVPPPPPPMGAYQPQPVYTPPPAGAPFQPGYSPPGSSLPDAPPPTGPLLAPPGQAAPPLVAAEDEPLPTGPLVTPPGLAESTIAPADEPLPTGPLAQPPVPPAEEPEPDPTVTLSPSMVPDWVQQQSGAVATQPAYSIKRDLQVEYTRQVYIQRACRVRVRIAPEAVGLAPLSKNEQRVYTAAERANVEFQAFEAEPLIKVELEFDEGAFTCKRTSQQKNLKRTSETHFDFALLPTKAADCTLTVNISYVRPVTVPERIAGKTIVERTIIAASGQAQKVREERMTVEPAHSDTEEKPVESLQLTVSVKSFLRMNTSEVGMLQKGLSLVLTAALVYLGVQSGKLTSVPYAVMSVAPLLGVPVGDATMKLIDRVTGG